MAYPGDSLTLVTIRPEDGRAQVRSHGVIYDAEDGKWLGRTPPSDVLAAVKASFHLLPGVAAKSAPKRAAAKRTPKKG